jgi:hypothetical protein
MTSQAALARKLPERPWGSRRRLLRSRMASSQTAWRRWSASRVIMLPWRSVTKGRTVLVVAVDLADGGVQVDGHGPIAGPAPTAHALVMTVSAVRSSWRMCPKVNERGNVPSVEGPSPDGGGLAAVDPVCSMSASSMQALTVSIACSSVSTLRPGR